jgi:hypothetical protein
MADILPELAFRHAALRARKEAVAARVLAMDERQRTTTPPDKGFTPAELVAHLAKTEEFHLGFLRKAPPMSIKGRAVKQGFFHKKILKTFQDLKRIAAPPMLIPPKQPDAAAEAGRLTGKLDEFEGFLTQVETMDKPLIKLNFLFGTLSVAQYLEFQEAHIAYHEHFFPKV